MKQTKQSKTHFDIAFKYYENGLYDKAITYFKKSIISQTKNEVDICDNIDSYIMIGMSFMSSDDNSTKCLENVIKYYTLAFENMKKTNYLAKSNSSFKMVYDDLGLAYHMLDDIPNAVKYYEKSVNFDDNISVPTYINLIYIYKNITNNLDKALQIALKFVEFDSQNETAYLELASIFDGLNKLDKAIKTLETSISKIEKPYKSFCNLSDVYLRKKEFEKAKEFALKSLEIEPNDYISISNLAEAYLGLGDEKLAKKHFIKALEIEPEFEPAIEGLSKFQ